MPSVLFRPEGLCYNGSVMKKETIWTYNFTLLTLITFVSYLGQNSIYSLLQLHMSDLGTSGALTGFVIGISSGLALLSRPFAGSILDSARKKPLLILCTALYSVALYGYAVSVNVALTIIFRVIFGLAMVFSGALTMAMATEALPEGKIGSGIGVFSLFAVISTALGPMISLAFQERFGVPAAFILCGTFNTIGLALCFLLRYPNEEKKKIRIDVRGAFAKEAAMPSVLMFLLQLSAAGITSFLVLFVESRGVTGMPLYYAANCIVLAVLRPFIGRISDRYGITRLLLPSIIIFAITLAFLPMVKSTGMLIGAAVLQAIGYGTAYPSAQALCMKLTPPEKHGAGSNTFYLCFDAGLFIGPTLAGAIKDAAGFGTMYIVSIVPLAAALIMVLLWSRKHKGL